MWMLKPFVGKEPVGLEGRTVDVGNVKVYVQNIIAEGGFSCVYNVQDAMHSSKQYALKHMICNDSESLDLVNKEISVMKLLRGHPNVVTLVAHAILDMGRRKEALLVMEYCEKSLVTMLENRGSGYLEEKKILLIFRDICNAVCAMHSQSPPIAHRDLKAENILLGPDGDWKLCDFGSTSTNHKCFDRLEEMGIEEDNIRKHTTPAYRAPEMWDLLRRDVICEKVDIWALGCLLYRICYLKSAFDGESKLQVLNGNYRIPDSPKFRAPITDLIKDMLQDSPNARPDILQIWFRVNELLPMELRKHLPDGCAGTTAMGPSTSDSQDCGLPRSLMPQRNPPPPPSSQASKETQHIRPSQEASKTGGSIGAFWSTQHAKDPSAVDNSIPIRQAVTNQNHNTLVSKGSLHGERLAHQRHQGKNDHGNPMRRVDESTREDFQINFFQDAKHGSQRNAVNSAEKPTFGNETYNTFVADFDNDKLNPKNSDARKKEELELEVVKLKEQLKKANLEKSEITSQYEKLSAICRSQRKEIQELKNSLDATNQSPSSKDTSKGSDSAATPREKIQGTIWDLQQGMMATSSLTPTTEPKPWKAFDEKPNVGLTNGHNYVASTGQPKDMWGFHLDSLASSSASQRPWSSAQGNTSQRFNGRETQKVDSNSKQPAGWAGF